MIAKTKCNYSNCRWWPPAMQWVRKCIDTPIFLVSYLANNKGHLCFHVFLPTWRPCLENTRFFAAHVLLLWSCHFPNRVPCGFSFLFFSPFTVYCICHLVIRVTVLLNSLVYFGLFQAESRGVPDPGNWCFQLELRVLHISRSSLAVSNKYWGFFGHTRTKKWEDITNLHVADLQCSRF